MADPQAPQNAQQPAPGGDDQDAKIIDQIGQLIQQLPPEKQKLVLEALEKMIGADDQEGPQPTQQMDPNAGQNGVPAGP